MSLFCSAIRKADLILYGHVAFAPLRLLQAVLNPKAKSLLMLHGIEAWDYRSALHAIGIRRMDRLVSISKYTLDRFRSAYRLPNAFRAHVVDNPVSPEVLSIGTTEDAAQDEISPSFLTVTRLAHTEQAKGVDTVIQAISALLANHPQLLYTAVGDDEDRPRLEALAGELGVAKDMRFLGHVSEEQLRQEYSRCTLFVMPSAKEGFGLVFVEAKAHGKPVIGARGGGAAEVIEHEHTGMLVEFGNVRELVRRLDELLSKPELRRRMGQAGREATQDRVSFDGYCARWESVCEELQGNRTNTKQLERYDECAARRQDPICSTAL